MDTTPESEVVKVTQLAFSLALLDARDHLIAQAKRKAAALSPNCETDPLRAEEMRARARTVSAAIHHFQRGHVEQ